MPCQNTDHTNSNNEIRKRLIEERDSFIKIALSSLPSNNKINLKFIEELIERNKNTDDVCSLRYTNSFINSAMRCDEEIFRDIYPMRTSLLVGGYPIDDIKIVRQEDKDKFLRYANFDHIKEIDIVFLDSFPDIFPINVIKVHEEGKYPSTDIKGHVVVKNKPYYQKNRNGKPKRF